MFRSGTFVSEHVHPIGEAQVQPNGIDLTVERVERPVGGGALTRTGKRIGDREPVDPVEGHFALDPGAYVVGYGERLAVPDGHVGFLLPRSSLLRNGCSLHTAVWDAGYDGRGAGLLTVGAAIEIEVEARIGQFVLAEANHADRYDGTYQHEGVEADAT